MTPRALFPIFATDVLAACRAFYSDLGFEVLRDTGGFLQLGWPSDPSLQIGFVERGLPDQSPVFQTRFRGGGVFLGIEVEDVDATHAELRRRGHRIVVPLTSEPWGRRHFGILDPNGVPIDLHTTTCSEAGIWKTCEERATAIA